MTENRSVKINSLLNIVKTFTSLIFPMITYPYALRVLGAGSIGKYGFSKSIVNYFVLFAGLGIARYATREGARLRDDKKKLEVFACQMLSVNVISTAISYAGLIVLLLYSNKLFEYRELILIQSLTIGLTTIGMDWIYACLEDYLFITIRSICVQLVSLVALFMFVRSESDLINYTWILTLSSCGAFILNFILIGKKYHLKLVFSGTSKHLRPILLLFASSISSMIYVNSDSTMIGYMIDDYTVGIYEAATKIYSVIQQMVSAALLVTLPRLSNYLANERHSEYRSLLSETICYVNTMIFPVVVGAFINSEDIILLIAGEGYLIGANTLKILCFSLFFSMYGILLTNAILLPMKREGTVTIAMSVAAAANVFLNLFVIPVLAQNGAALTTVFSEFLVMLIQLVVVHKHIRLVDFRISECLGIVIGTCLICVTCITIQHYVSVWITRLFLNISISVIVYGTVQILFKNRLAMSGVRVLKHIIIRR